MDSIKDAIEAMRGSMIERGKVRPAWIKQKRVFDAGIWWTKEDLGIDGWTLQRNRFNRQFLRLVQESTGRFIGWGFDEDFMCHELFPLQTKTSGFVNLEVGKSLERTIRFVYFFDLYTTWRKHETLEGTEIAHGIF